MLTDQTNYTLYGLRISGEIRYIGITSTSLSERLRSHLRDPQKNHRTFWIQKAKQENKAIEIIPYCVGLPSQEAKELEIFLIRDLKQCGIKLVNGTPGGDGLGRGKEHPSFGKKRSSEVVEKTARFHRGSKRSFQTKKILATQKRGVKNLAGFSKFVGVGWIKNQKIWQARIQVNGKRVVLGRFYSEEDAAHVYDYAAKKYFGDSAKVNFP